MPIISIGNGKILAVIGAVIDDYSRAELEHDRVMFVTFKEFRAANKLPPNVEWVIYTKKVRYQTEEELSSDAFKERTSSVPSLNFTAVDNPSGIRDILSQVVFPGYQTIKPIPFKEKVYEPGVHLKASLRKLILKPYNQFESIVVSQKIDPNPKKSLGTSEEANLPKTLVSAVSVSQAEIRNGSDPQVFQNEIRGFIAENYDPAKDVESEKKRLYLSFISERALNTYEFTYQKFCQNWRYALNMAESRILTLNGDEPMRDVIAEIESLLQISATAVRVAEKAATDWQAEILVRKKVVEKLSGILKQLQAQEQDLKDIYDLAEKGRNLEQRVVEFAASIRTRNPTVR